MKCYYMYLVAIIIHYDLVTRAFGPPCRLTPPDAGDHNPDTRNDSSESLLYSCMITCMVHIFTPCPSARGKVVGRVVIIVVICR